MDDPKLIATVAKYLGTLHASASGMVTLAEALEGVRRLMPPKRRKRLRRCDVREALTTLGIIQGIANRRAVIVGYSIGPPAPPLTVDESGEVQEVAA